LLLVVRLYILLDVYPIEYQFGNVIETVPDPLLDIVVEGVNVIVNVLFGVVSPRIAELELN
jgi:hypothetical protein